MFVLVFYLIRSEVRMLLALIFAMTESFAGILGLVQSNDMSFPRTAILVMSSWQSMDIADMRCLQHISECMDAPLTRC